MYILYCARWRVLHGYMSTGPAMDSIRGTATPRPPICPLAHPHIHCGAICGKSRSPACSRPACIGRYKSKQKHRVSYSSLPRPLSLVQLCSEGKAMETRLFTVECIRFAHTPLDSHGSRCTSCLPRLHCTPVAATVLPTPPVHPPPLHPRRRSFSASAPWPCRWPCWAWLLSVYARA